MARWLPAAGRGTATSNISNLMKVGVSITRFCLHFNLFPFNGDRGNCGLAEGEFDLLGSGAHARTTLVGNINICHRWAILREVILDLVVC